MPTITLVEFNGREHTIEAEPGKTLMQNALDNMVLGIDADCGGACACGTCHCFVPEEWQAVAGDADPMEESMLGMRPDRADTSRLSCQIQVSEAMDGMVIRLPIPELNEERRQELAKVAGGYAENARIAVRNVRKDGMDQVKKAKNDIVFSPGWSYPTLV